MRNKRRVYKISRLVITGIVSIVVSTELVHQATAQSYWQEPECDPSTDPTTCNVAAPLNVSDSDQTKVGGLQIEGTLQATNSFIFTGSASSFSVTSNSITESMVMDDITAGKFKGTGSTSDAVDLATGEVSGTLPSSAVADDWVNEVGDTMTGTLDMKATGDSINIDQTNAGGAEGIYIDRDATATGYAISLIDSSTSVNAHGINVDLNSAARRGINIDVAAGSGVGLYAHTNGATSTGVYGYSETSTGRGVVGITGTLSGSLPGPYAGVYGVSYATALPGVYGVSSATDAPGVSGESTISFGITGNTGSSSSYYGAIGCYAKTNCGYLGGSQLAGKFDGRVAGDDFLPLDEERFGFGSFRAGGKWGSLSLSGVDWENVTFMGSDGEEIWINQAHPANPNIFRVNAAMLVQNTSQSPGSVGFRGVTLGSKGFVTVRNTDGEICVWEKDAATFSCPGTPDTDLQYTESLWFDGEYYWAGRTGGRGITQFDNSYTLATSNPTAATAGGGANASVIDFTQDETYIYALEDTDISVSPSQTRILVIDRSTNGRTAEYIFPNWEARALEFDGKFIWATAITSTGQDGLIRLDPVTGAFQFLDFSAKYATEFDYPKDLLFDGTFLWVTLQNSFMLTRISPLQTDTASPIVIEDDFIEFSYAPQQIAFDGEAIFVLVRDTSGSGVTALHRLFSGKGYGYQTTTVFPQEGISTWDVSTGDGACIQVDAGALVVKTGALCN